ncbi:MAG: ABC transporter permease [Spirochaetes bacterium]|jgi:phospholipid/cholesterol/gamma-HCH transport system permease protein|nr:ABC transporter permease [Spirochaetota bacterium]
MFPLLKETIISTAPAAYLIKKSKGALAGFNEFRSYIQDIILSFRSFRKLRFRAVYSIILNQTRFTGIHAIPVVASIAILVGGTVIIQSMSNLPQYGLQDFFGNLMVIIIARELGPLSTALIVITRSGSAITTEIATQKWSSELLSLEAMGIDTKLYIVFPRIMASILSIFSLIIFFDLIAFLGGYIISRTVAYIPLEIFFIKLLKAFSFNDLVSTVLKSLLYGVLIPLVCCYYGFKPASKFEVPIYVSRAVIRTTLVVFGVNAAVSLIFYFI